MRIQMTEEDINLAVKQIMESLSNAMEKHGSGAFASPHEALGDLTEEYHELIDTVRENDSIKFKAELSDIAVSCIWAIASKNAFNRIKESEKTE